MKRIFAILFMLMFLFIPSAFAAQPDISSDSQTFNPFTGVYDLKGHVHVDLGDRVIDGDAAQVYLYQLEVHAQGNISLTDKPTGIHFDCDSVEVKGNERTAYVNGITCVLPPITAALTGKPKMRFSPETLPLTARLMQAI